ncbi:MAG: Zinc finger CCCH domain-containing protein 4 [Marteilia pararefringens]
MCGKMPPRSIENKLGYKRDSSTHPDQIKKRDKVLARKTRNIRENYNKDGYSIQRAINRAKQSDIIKRNQQKMDNKSYYEKTNCNIKAKRGFCENDACRFNHDFEVKKMESVCKYYTTDSCNKGDACIFMHGEYPCKYFHIRNFCFNADSCKFSHKPLTETGKRLIEDIKAKINENKQLKQNQTGIEVSFGTRIPHAEPINLNPTDKFRDIMNQSMVQSGINGLPLQNLNHSSHELISNLQGMEHASYLGIDLSSSCNPYTNNAMPHTEEITNLKQPEDVSNNNENITNEMSESFSLIKFTGKKICSLPQGHIDNKDPRVERYKVCKV